MREVLGELDLHLFSEGSNDRMYEHLGAQLLPGGVHFAVWAPDALAVSVVGDFNGWDRETHPMFPTETGIWKAWLADVEHGQTYKFAIQGRSGEWFEKADPYAFASEVPPKSASVVWPLDFDWDDDDWLDDRGARIAIDAPVAIYELHPGSWRRKGVAESLSYRELAEPLVEHILSMGYTHVEFMPVAEHPFYPSWGYQVTGYFAPTARYGTPQDLMYLVNALHRADIGVILDWVPSHFATDGHGLVRFDGSALYEHQDPAEGFHPDWGSYIFNYGRNEVRSFLLSSARFWVDRYHVDGLRVDGVASMLYRDYSREHGEWVPNIHGGNENLEAAALLRDLNVRLHGEFPGVTTIAEESTAWPGVSRPVHDGGLGFGYKWDMGWMHDTLAYFSREPVHRAHHQDELTFRMLYAYDENFVLSLSHDEVVHGKGSLLTKMPGDDWQQFANLRALYGYQYGLPGKKLLFMGGEIGQRSEWNVDGELEWWVLDEPSHQGVRGWVSDLNSVYRAEQALWSADMSPGSFEWVDTSDRASSILSFARHSPSGRPVLVVLNLTPVAREGYRLGVESGGTWQVLLNSDSASYWGSGAGSTGTIAADAVPMHGRSNSLSLDLPPLGVLFVAPATATATG
jgi:1,4-alpha-glucan branching enzyme